MLKKLLIAALSLWILPFATNAAITTGTVTRVVDGDTRAINASKQTLKIRFYGIDAPEKAQPFGSAAKNFLKTELANKRVTIINKALDKYGRTVGIIYSGKKNINETLVNAGFAWVYPQYCKKHICAEWRELEKQAKQNGVGLWKQPNPTPPWEFRKQKY